METGKVAFEESHLFGNLFSDFLNKKEELKKFVTDFISVNSIKDNLNSFEISSASRKILSDELNAQYKHLEFSEAVSKNISSLISENTFTVTTGHQLCLFTGPAYFIYKIISVIKTCEQLNKEIPAKNFVPVYWMATEDHDLEEINHAYFFGKKVQWNMNGKGRAGELSTEGIAEVITEVKSILGEGENANAVINLFQEAYTRNKDLASATRFLVNKIFGSYGLIVLDGNSPELKKLFAGEIKDELLNQSSFSLVNSATEELKKLGYSSQVSPREINLFYAAENLRERIVEKNGVYEVLNTGKKFSEDEILALLEKSPESFSPNVVLRPLYQQKILPNVIYCGGPGEIAYWLQYKSLFDHKKISYPFLLPRNFIVQLDKKSAEKWNKLGFELKDLFLQEEELIKTFVKGQSGEISLEDKRIEVTSLFSELEKQAETTDKTLVNFVSAEKQKALNSIASIESKFNKALKTKNETGINQLSAVKSKVFPLGNFQERRENFFSFINFGGIKLLEDLIESVPSPIDCNEITVFLH